ncbi:hypothetical protein [Paenisporosarcina sp. TG20]|uniref:hypothetical protein n=1 Tax=Paenisporosarcina sp. TG20 TaxID=1211706 RepID=UPI00031D6D3B|nr:hypothetical protein [Paenisporosarcina sp. TG20]
MTRIEQLLEQLSLLEHILEARFIQERSIQTQTIINNGHRVDKAIKATEQLIEWNICSRKSG